MAGRDVTEHLQQLLRKSGRIFHTSAEKETVKNIKEATGYVALDPAKEEKDWSGSSRTEGKSIDYTLPDGQKLKVRRRKRAVCGHWLTGLDWGGTLPSTRDSVQPGDHRPRIPRCAPNRRRGDSQDRHGPTQSAIRQHCALGWVHTDKRIRKPAAPRGATTGGERHEDQDLSTPRAHLHHVDWRKHSGRSEHLQKGKSRTF